MSFRIMLTGFSEHGRRRFYGASQAKFDWLLFTDDDCLKNFNWLENYLAWIGENGEDNSVAGCGGDIVRFSEDIYSKYIDWQGCMKHPGESATEAYYLITANALYKRSVFEEVGGFNSSFKWLGGKDPELSSRIRSNGFILHKLQGAGIQHLQRSGIKRL